MSIAFRASSGIGVAQNTATTSTATTGATQTVNAGDIIIVVVSIRTATSTVSSITDTAGNTYSLIPGAAINNTVRVEIWASFAKFSSTTNAITVNLGAGSKFTIDAAAYSGASVIGPVATSTQGTANPTQSFTTTTVGSFVVGGFAGQGTGTFAISTGNSRAATTTSGGGSNTNVGGAIADNTAASTGSLTVAYTSTDTTWAMAIIELQTVSVAAWMPIQRIAGPESVSLKYASPAFDSPVEVIPFVPPSATLDNWTPTLGSVSSQRGYSRVVADVGVAIPSATITIDNWIGNVGNLSIPPMFSSGDLYKAPEKVLPSVSIPSISGWAGTDGQKSSLTALFAGSESTLPVSVSIQFIFGWKSTDGQNAQPQNFASVIYSAPDKFGLTATPSISGWLSTDGQKAVTSNYAIPDFVSQINPTLALLPIMSGLAEIPWFTVGKFLAGDIFTAPDKFGQVAAAPVTISSWTPTTGVFSSNRGYARSIADVGSSTPSLSVPTISGWLGTDGQRAVLLPYSAGIYSSPDKFGLVTVIIPTIGSWKSNTGQKSVALNYTSSDYSAPAKYDLITSAVVFVSSWHVDFTPPRTFLNYSRIEDSQLKGVALPAFPPTFPEWNPDNFQNSITLRYAPVDYSAPSKFGIIVPSPITISNWTPTIGQKSVLLNYALTDYSAPPKFGLITPSLITIAGWTPTIGQKSVVLNYVQCDSVNQLNPTLALVPISFLQYLASNSIVLSYASTDYSSPPRFALIAAPSISGWLATEGAKSIALKYTLSDFVNQIRPTLATLPSDASFTMFIASNSLSRKFAGVHWDAPPKFGIIAAAPITITSWTGTDGQKAVILKYAVPDFINQIRPTLATLPSSTSYIAFTAPNAQPQKFAIISWDAPAKFNLTVAAVSFIAAFNINLVPNAVAINYSRIEDSQLKGAALPVFPTTLPEWLPDFNIISQKQIFFQGATSAPDKFGLVAPSAPTIAGWTSTLGQKAVILTYASPDFVNQVRPTLATLPTLLFGISEIAPNAQPQKFATTDWSAPAKFGIVVPAPITIANWFGTDGQKAIILKYALPDFVNQVRPTLATLSSSVPYLDFIAPNAQPQKFASPDFVTQTAPTLATLPSGLATDFTVWGRPANPPTFSAGDIFTGPPAFALGFISSSILVRGVIFYQPLARNVNVNTKTVKTFIINGVVVKIVVVE